MRETYLAKSKIPLPAKCPRCGSGAIKRRDMIHKSGTSIISGKRSFWGMSVGLSGKTRPRIFAGSSSGHGGRATLRAQEAAPMSYNPAIKAFLFFGILSLATPWFLLGVLWGFILLFVAIDDNRAYTREWWCNKCGGMFRVKVTEIIEEDVVQQPPRLSSKKKKSTKTKSEEALKQAAYDFVSETKETSLLPDVTLKTNMIKQTKPLLPNLDKIERGVKKYCEIQTQFYSTDVSNDRDFQRLFNGYYRIRRNSEWQGHFYELLERSKNKPMSFEEVLRTMHTKTGNIEASFSSKLIATCSPDSPVIDKHVLENMNMSLPRPNEADRLEKTILLYQQLITQFEECLKTNDVKAKIDAFQKHFPQINISDVKALDFILWQTRDTNSSNVSKKTTTNGGKAIPFDWDLIDSKISFKNKNNRCGQFELTEIFYVLNWLKERFSDEWFPLANSVSLMGNGTEKDGLGNALLSYRPNDITHAQEASYLGVILQEINLLEWNQKKKGIQWRIIYEPKSVSDLRLKTEEYLKCGE